MLLVARGDTYNLPLMSQITRCPSCATSFKVVADQLRISEGWVRCGQCKEVFDASAHLLPAPPPALLPDVSLADARPPPVAVVRKETAKAWGESAQKAAVPSAGHGVPVAAGPGPQDPQSDLDLATLVGISEPVLDVPGPAVPSFLAAGELGAEHDPLAPFVWNTRRSPVPEATHAINPLSPLGVAPSIGAAAAADEPIARERPVSSAGSSSAPLMEEFGVARPAAFKSPAPDLHAPLAENMFAEVTAPEADPWLAQRGYPPLDIPESASTPVAKHSDAAFEAHIPLPDVLPDAISSLDAQSLRLSTEAEVLALVEDDSPAALLRVKSRKSSNVELDGEDDEAFVDPADEVSFVVTARRKAFWRKPAVRLVLLLVLMLSILGLAAQTAVQERDRLAAMDARARPWLMRLCEAFQCQIAPRRQISDVVIDSSSFNKARGDSYQLTLAMKNRAATPVAMPAVELTLTDAQDQPVLRRVLLPADMAAPSELAGQGDWATSLSVIVTTGGARVAGYRLLAFYP